MKEILEPAIRMAKEGVPHYEINARSASLSAELCGFRADFGSGRRAKGSSKRCRLIGKSESSTFDWNVSLIYLG
jgi:hypothetical protein